MSVTILQLCSFWFLLQNKHKTSAFFLDFLLTVNKDRAVKKSAFGSDKNNFSLKINSSSHFSNVSTA